jgi:hypothetical protein
MHNIETPELPVEVKEIRDKFLVEVSMQNEQLGNGRGAST